MSSSSSPTRIHLGTIATAHGVRGLVKVMVHADDPRALEKYGPVFTAAAGGKALSLSLKNPLGAKDSKFWLATVEGVADRTQAELLRGTELWLDRDKLPPAPAGQHYAFELLGLRVRDPAGADIGTVRALENFGASDLLEIRPDSGESFYVVFSTDVVLSIDIGNGFIVVDRPTEI